MNFRRRIKPKYWHIHSNKNECTHTRYHYTKNAALFLTDTVIHHLFFAKMKWPFGHSNIPFCEWQWLSLTTWYRFCADTSLICLCLVFLTEWNTLCVFISFMATNLRSTNLPYEMNNQVSRNTPAHLGMWCDTVDGRFSCTRNFVVCYLFIFCCTLFIRATS